MLASLHLLAQLRPAFTRPSFYALVQVALGWLPIPARHGVGAALVAGAVSGRRHHASERPCEADEGPQEEAIPACRP